MRDAILMSIRPKYCESIASGKQTVIITKTKPKLETPFKVYMYCTKQTTMGELLLTYDKKVEGRNRGFRDNGDIPLKGKVIGEFICDKICEFKFLENGNFQCRNSYVYLGYSCLTYDKLINYIGEDKTGYAWNISNLVIYDTPKELNEFYNDCEEPEEKCEDCPYLRVENTPYYYDVYCELNEKLYIKKAPAGWCYVKRLGGCN